MAAYGITLAIAIFSGALCGFLANLLPHPRQIFDDDENIADVNYGDDLDKYNADPEAELEMQEVPDTARTEPDDKNRQQQQVSDSEKDSALQSHSLTSRSSSGQAV